MIKPDISLVGFIHGIKKRLQFRNLLALVAILFGFSFYYVVIEFYEPSKNFISLLSGAKKSFNFYTGSPGGYYIEIGKELSSYFKNNGDIELNNNPTSGGLDNVVKVISKGNAFGLVQESTLGPNDMLRNYVDYVTPLYMERLHILYRKEEKNNAFPLTANKDNLTEIIGNKRVSIGPVGSGTRIISTYLMDISDQEPAVTHSYNARTGLEKLINNDIDILFNITGAPMPEIYDVLSKNPEIGLLGVSPTLVQKINEEFGTNYRLSNFKEKYPLDTDISTIGSYAYLIKSKDVSNQSALSLLKGLSITSNEIKKKMGFNNLKGNYSFPLNEIDYLSGIKSNHDDSNIQMIKSLLLFLVATFTSSFLALWVLIWVSSSFKLSRYYRELALLYQRSFGFRVKLDFEKDILPVPIQPESRIHRIRTVCEGMESLFKLFKRVRNDYETGGISESHFKDLNRSFKESLNDHRTALTRSLYYEVSYSKSFTITKETIIEYYTGSLLTKEQMQELLDLRVSI